MRTSRVHSGSSWNQASTCFTSRKRQHIPSNHAKGKIKTKENKLMSARNLNRQQYNMWQSDKWYQLKKVRLNLHPGLTTQPSSYIPHVSLLIYSSCKPPHINLSHVNPSPTGRNLTTRGDVDQPQLRQDSKGEREDIRIPAKRARRKHMYLSCL